MQLRRIQLIGLIILYYSYFPIQPIKGDDEILHIKALSNIAGKDNRNINHKNKLDLSALGPGKNFYDYPTINVQLIEDGPIESFEKVAGSKDKDEPLYANTPNGKYSLELARAFESDVSNGSFTTTTEATVGVIKDIETDTIYKLSTNANGEHVLSVKKGSDYQPEEEPHSLGDENDRRNLRNSIDNDNKENHFLFPKSHQQNNNATTQSRNLQDRPRLDVMVIWTGKAECRNSGESFPCVYTSQTVTNMMATIQLAISQTNMAFQTSGVNAEVNLAVAYRHPSYIEDDLGGYSATVKALFDIREEIHTQAMRANYGADLVHTLVDSDVSCGVGFLGPAYDYAYAATNVACATSVYTFVHELGHNLGCNHDRGAARGCSSSNTNFGYRDPQARLRTIMAYPCLSGDCDNIPSGNCARVLRFSHAGTYNGIDVGNSFNDNVLQINSAATLVSNFHAAPIVALEPPVIPTSEPTPAPVFIESNNECFSPITTVVVQDKGRIKMTDLKVGSKVLTSSGEYQTVYIFDHFDHSKPTTFIQIQIESSDDDDDNQSSLELTSNHMLYVVGKSYPVPASEIRVGNMLQTLQGSAKVIKINTISRNGFYNPQTADGTIIVNGIIASTFTSISSKTHIEIGGVTNIISIHKLVNLAAAPYQAICVNMVVNFCNQHNNNNEYYAKASRIIMHLFTFWLKQHNVIKWFMFVIYVSVFGVTALALKLNNAFLTFAVASFLSWLLVVKRVKQ